MPENSNQFISLKDAIQDLSNKVDGLHENISNLRVEMSDKYVKKEDFAKYQAKNEDMHKSILTWIIGVFTLLVTAIGTIYAYCSHNFSSIFEKLINLR